MANLKLRRSENISGDIYVDNTCIDCDTCRWMSPEIFHRNGEKSAVYHQPKNDTERLEVMQAFIMLKQKLCSKSYKSVLLGWKNLDLHK